MASFIVYYYLLLSVIEFVVTIVRPSPSLSPCLHCVAKLWRSQEYNEFCISNIIYACSQHALPSAFLPAVPLPLANALGQNRVACFGPMKMLINSCDTTRGRKKRTHTNINKQSCRLPVSLLPNCNRKQPFQLPVPAPVPAWVLVPALSLYQISML